MKLRIVLVFAMLVSLALGTFAEQKPVKYKIDGNQIIFTFNGIDVPYTLGTKTAEYIMGFLANSIFDTDIRKINVSYNGQTYSTVQFSNWSMNGPDYRLAFLRVEDLGVDVIYLYKDTDLIATIPITLNEAPANVLKVDYMVGQIIKWMISYYLVHGNNPTQYFCITIEPANVIGIPTVIEFFAHCP
jgi:hypothetical protein